MLIQKVLKHIELQQKYQLLPATHKIIRRTQHPLLWANWAAVLCASSASAIKTKAHYHSSHGSKLNQGFLLVKFNHLPPTEYTFFPVSFLSCIFSAKHLKTSKTYQIRLCFVCLRKKKKLMPYLNNTQETQLWSVSDIFFYFKLDRNRISISA